MKEIMQTIQNIGFCQMPLLGLLSGRLFDNTLPVGILVPLELDPLLAFLFDLTLLIINIKNSYLKKALSVLGARLLTH